MSFFNVLFYNFLFEIAEGNAFKNSAFNGSHGKSKPVDAKFYFKMGISLLANTNCII